MPKRNNVRTVNTEYLQGENSYIVIRRMTVGEVRAMMKQSRKLAGRDEDDDAGDVAISISSEMLATHVLEWNWVDNEGEALPKPHDNETVFDLLTDEEFQFLSEQLLGSRESRKN